MTTRARLLLGVAALIALTLVGAAIAGTKGGHQSTHRQVKVGLANIHAKQQETTPTASSATSAQAPAPARVNGTAVGQETESADVPETESEEPVATEDDPADAQEANQTAEQEQVGEDDQGEQDNAQGDEDDQGEQQEVEDTGTAVDEPSGGSKQDAGPADDGDHGGDQGGDGGDD